MEIRVSWAELILQNNLLEKMDKVDMSNRNKDIIKRYFDGKHTYTEIGKEFGITGNRVRQIIFNYYRKARLV